MEFFDSHAHYNDEKFDEDREKILQEIYDAGITKFMSAGYNVKASKKGLEIADKYDFIYTTSGISPNDITTIEDANKQIEQLDEFIKSEMEECNKKEKKSKIVGIGEIGLDYYYDENSKDAQKWAFIEQIKLANKYKLPIVIHTREAVMDTLDILKNKQPAEYKGVFHCCPLNRELVKEALKLGFYISFSGIVTFKNAKNAEEIVNMVPLDRILIETDSPYLSPEPVRGTRNDSRNVKYVAQKVAILKNETLENIANATFNNAKKIFKII